jgi:hypothetical protein
MHSPPVDWARSNKTGARSAAAKSMSRREVLNISICPSPFSVSAVLDPHPDVFSVCKFLAKRHLSLFQLFTSMPWASGGTQIDQNEVLQRSI